MAERIGREREILKKILMLYREDKSCMDWRTANEIQVLLDQPEQTEQTEQTEQEPVAWMYEPEPLSDERLRDLSNSIHAHPDFDNVSVWQVFYIARAIEKAHGIGGGE